MMRPPGTTEDIRISVVIPTYQRCASVRRTLEALARQTMAPSEYEVIVPIDGSDDGTKEMIERFQAPYRLSATWHPNQGRAAARNVGIRMAQGHLIVFLDDDMEPVPGFLLAHVDAHPSGSRRAVIGPVPIPVDASSPPLLRYRSSGMDAQLGRLAQAGYRIGFRDMYSGNLSMPCDVLREVGRSVASSSPADQHDDFETRVQSALKVLVAIGGAAEVERHEDKVVIVGNGCPLAAAVAVHPEVCHLAETLVSEIVKVPVEEHCNRQGTPKCRFEIKLKKGTKN